MPDVRNDTATCDRSQECAKLFRRFDVPTVAVELLHDLHPDRLYDVGSVKFRTHFIGKLPPYEAGCPTTYPAGSDATGTREGAV